MQIPHKYSNDFTFKMTYSKIWVQLPRFFCYRITHIWDWFWSQYMRLIKICSDVDIATTHKINRFDIYIVPIYIRIRFHNNVVIKLLHAFVTNDNCHGALYMAWEYIGEILRLRFLCRSQEYISSDSLFMKIKPHK